MNTIKDKIFLGISPGSRAMGFAILKEAVLVDWQVKAFKQPWSKHKATIIFQTILAIIKEHQPGCMVIKTLPQTKPNKTINSFLKKLTQTLRHESINVIEYSIFDLKKSLPQKIKTKQHLMQHVISVYPQLQSIYFKEISNRNPYHIKVFEALLAAHCALEQINIST